MAYNPTIWVDDTVPDIDADNLNKIEQGIATADANATAAKTEVENVRIGADGTVYSSAGDAVRACIAPRIRTKSIPITLDAGCIDTSLNTASTTTSRIKHCAIDVNSGENYLVTCYAINSTYPAAFVYNSTTSAYSVLLSGSQQGYTNQSIIIPSGYDKIYLNTAYQKTDYPLAATLKFRTTSTEFWDWAEPNIDLWEKCFSTKKIKSPKYFVKYADNKVYVVCSKVTSGADLLIIFEKKGVNNIFDFSRTYYNVNTTDVVSSDCNDSSSNRITIASDTDWISPYVVYADNNIDGDHPDAAYYTGGVHGYMSETGTALSTTGRTTNVSLFVDGVEMTNGNSAYCDDIRLHWTNRVQASNTEKQDGTGREVLEEMITVEFDGTKINVSNQIKALEDISFEKYYGISIPQVADANAKRFYIGSNANRVPNVMGQTNNSGDKKCNIVKLESVYPSIYMGVNPIDIGTFDYNEDAYSFLSGSTGKTYAQMIKSISHNFKLAENARMVWSGFYCFGKFLN